MKLALETESDLQARAFLAATIGPFRRPQGRAQQKVLNPGVIEQFAQNNTSNRVLFVAVISIAGLGQAISYTRSGSGGQPFPIGSTTQAFFILYPGEQLYAGGAGVGQTFDIFTEEF